MALQFGRARAVGLALVVSTAFTLSLAHADEPTSPAGEAPAPVAETPAPVAETPTLPASSPPGDPAPAPSADAPASGDPATTIPVVPSTDDAGAIDLSAIAGGPPEPGAESDAAPAARESQPKLEAGSGVRVKLICTNCNAASLWVNGLSGDHVRVWMDGMPTVSGLGSVYTLSQFPSDLVGYTHVTHGPGSVLSGSAAIGGTIEFHSVERTREQKALLDIQLADDAFQGLKLAGADRWGPFGALVFLQGSTSNKVDANGDGWSEIADYERVTAQGIFDFHLTDNQVLTVDLGSYGEDQLDGPGAPRKISIDPAPEEWDKDYEDAFFNWQSYALRWNLKRPSGLRASFGGRYSRRQQQQWAPDLASTPADPLPDVMTFRIEDEQATARFQAEIPLAGGVLTTGASWSHQNLQVLQKYVLRGQPHFIVDNLDQDELWAEYARSLSAKWDASLGVRGDRFEAYGRTVKRDGFPAVIVHETDPVLRYDRFEPRAQVHFRPNSKVVLGLAIGKGSVGPVPAFTETCCGARYQRSLHLRPEDATSYQASVEIHPTPDMRVSTRLFRTDFDDYQQKVVYHSEAYIAYYTRKNIPEAHVQGIDIVHDMRFKDDRYNVGWTWTIADHEGSEVYATDENNEFILGPTGPELVGTDGDPLAYVPKHSGSAYFRYNHVARGTSINFNWSYQGSLRHYALSYENREDTDPWPYLESEPYWTADVDFEQRLGQKGWSVYGGIRDINNYVQSDLSDLNRIYDWGPIQGRTGFVGMKFSR